MKILDEYYLLTIGIILIGLPTLFYFKINQPQVYTYNIVIYGDTIDASMLAYYIDKNIEKEGLSSSKVISFNITLISPPQSSSAEPQEDWEEIDKQMISFCGVEREWMQFLDDSKLKYYIKEYGVYFGEMYAGSQKNQFDIYSIETNFVSSLAKYGLSNFAANKFFLKFAQNINRATTPAIQYNLEQMSLSLITKNVFPSDIEDGLQYFSQSLGLDQNYIQQFILPVVIGNYFHEANSLSTLYKLLPVFCHKRPEIGESLVLFEYPHKIKEKMLLEVTNARLNFINDKRLETYSIIKDADRGKKKYVNVILTKKSVLAEEQNQLVISNQTSRTYIKSDIFFIFQDIDSSSTGRQYSYYKTIIDGRIKNDHLYEEFFTIYLKATPKKREEGRIDEGRKEKTDSKLADKNHNPIYSITRICAYNCKGFENSIYVLISKHKLSSSKNLNMFESQNMVYFKKYYAQQAQTPTNKKLQESENVYKIYDIDSMSDSYELQLQLVKEIAEAFLRKVKQQCFQ